MEQYINFPVMIVVLNKLKTENYFKRTLEKNGKHKEND